MTPPVLLSVAEARRRALAQLREHEAAQEKLLQVKLRELEDLL